MTTMRNDIIDVAEGVLVRTGPISTASLHHFVCLADRLHREQTGTPLFHDEIVQTPTGPVVPALYALHLNITPVSPGFFYEARAHQQRVVTAARLARVGDVVRRGAPGALMAIAFLLGLRDPRRR